MPRPYLPNVRDRALDGEQFLSSAGLMKRYDCSHMWPERQQGRDSNFPKPYYVAGRRFWKVSELLVWEAGLPREKSPSAAAGANQGRRRAVAARKAAAGGAVQ